MGQRTVDGYRAGSSAPVSVIVLHEAYGLWSPKSNISEVCDRLAENGFQAVTPDLYHGATAATVDDALDLMRKLRPEDAMAAVEAAAATLRREKAERMAVLGFCMGGALSFRSVLELDDLRAAVLFYGTPRGDFARLVVPVLGHFALRDEFVAVNEIRAIEAQLVRAGQRVAFHYYDADHGFMNAKLPAYASDHAAVAWERTIEFLDMLAPRG